MLILSPHMAPVKALHSSMRSSLPDLFTNLKIYRGQRTLPFQTWRPWISFGSYGDYAYGMLRVAKDC
jgi:hypothetical protein